MELLTLLLALTSFLGGVLAVAGGPYCTFTSAWRQFNYTCTIGSLVNLDNLTVQFYAYNWTCQQIGHTSSQIGGTFNFNTLLDSVVVINFNNPTLPPRFMYAGKHYGQNAKGTLLPDPICYNSGGQNACETQFDCGKEVNMGDFEGGQQWRDTMILTQQITPDNSTIVDSE